MKKLYWNIVLIIVFALGTFLSISFAEGIHNLYKDLGFSIVNAILVGFILQKIINKTRKR